MTEHVTSALRQEGPQQEREHELKTWPDYFASIESGVKTFEVRKDDRDFLVGDVLILREWNPDTATYSGRSVRRVVSYILTTFAGIEPGYVCMALSASRTAQAPQQEQDKWFIEQLRLWWKRLDDSPKWFHAMVGAMLDDWESRPVPMPERTELAAAQARIRVLETSVDYLRNLIDHPVTQEPK